MESTNLLLSLYLLSRRFHISVASSPRLSTSSLISAVRYDFSANASSWGLYIGLMCFKNSALNLGYFLNSPLKGSNVSFSNLIPLLSPGLAVIIGVASFLSCRLIKILPSSQILLYTSRIFTIQVFWLVINSSSLLVFSELIYST